MKILHVLETMSPRYGGPVAVLNALSRAQAKLGHEVRVVTTNRDFPTGKMASNANETVREAGVAITYFNSNFRPLNVSVPMAFALPGLIGESDILHVHGLYRFPPTYAARAARLRKRPYIIRPFGSLDPFMYAQSSKSLKLKRIYEKLFDLPNLHGAGAIHYTTEDERSRAGFLNLRAPGFIIPNGLDWSRYETLPGPGAFRARLGLGEDVPLILFLGRVNFKKGLDLAVRAFKTALAAFPAVKLVIAGPDNDGYGQVIRKLIGELGIGDNVIFVEMLNGKAVQEAFVDADVFVLSSYSENFGMTVIEALSCATPVVISDQVNIFREVQSSGGGLVTPCDSEKIADAMMALLQAPERRRAMGALGREWVRETYDWPKIVPRLDAQYEEVIKRTAAAFRE
jgi:glycosyltransferase involved in cell wall biosynthesis